MTTALPSGALLLKGPLLVLIVTGVLLYPYIVTLSTKAIVCLGILVVGLCLTAWDLTRVFKRQLRHAVRRGLDSLVLDDLLKSLYDPETGLLAILITTVLGNASMYALPMTTEHRLRLMKSCFWTSDEQTQRILTAPGGIKEFLPESTRKWLENEEEQQAIECEAIDVKKVSKTPLLKPKPPTAPNSSEERSVDVGTVVTVPDDDSADDRVHTVRSPQRTSRALDVGGPTSPSPKKSRGDEIEEGEIEKEEKSPRIHIPPQFEDPLVAMGEILKDIGLDVWKRHVQTSLPPIRAIQAVGVAAGAGLIAHLRASPLARKILRGVLEGSLTMGLAGTAMSAFAAGIVSDPQATDLLRSLAKDPIAQGSALVNAVRGLVPKQLASRWNTITALAVLALVGQLRASRSGFPRRRRPRR